MIKAVTSAVTDSCVRHLSWHFAFVNFCYHNNTANILLFLTDEETEA